mmetsp:Transcript_17462/g.22228  ORF Transcript_17462/g.22228 Transcript_17462/m.22228 type:complete len:161 (+) Transcript_17462:52-534(+)
MNYPVSKQQFTLLIFHQSDKTRVIRTPTLPRSKLSSFRSKEELFSTKMVPGRTPSTILTDSDTASSHACLGNTISNHRYSPSIGFAPSSKLERYEIHFSNSTDMDPSSNGNKLLSKSVLPHHCISPHLLCLHLVQPTHSHQKWHLHWMSLMHPQTHLWHQ